LPGVRRINAARPAIIAAGAVWLICVPGFAGEDCPAVVVHVDRGEVLGPVPALRGIHMAPLEGGYQEEDVLRLKEIGVRCVRLGFSGYLLEQEDEPGQYDEEGFGYLGQFVGWCEKHGIGVILDMHNAVGRRKWEDTRIWRHYFGSKDPKEYQDRFVVLWREIARRFAGRKGVLAYELLNEPNPPEDDFEVWNKLVKRATEAIKEVDQIHPVIVDSIGYANPTKFRGLKPTRDASTIYSFHSYEPAAYHKQKRPWALDVNGETYYYPGVVNGRYWNRSQLRAFFEPAVEFARKHGVELFCGEFGCVSDCPEMTDMIYLMDQISLFHELGIGWTMYGYMRRESKPYWKSHFDCNLFIYYVPEARLYRFERKINLIRFFLETDGEVLSIEQPKDEDVTCYGVREPAGKLLLLLSNKDRRKGKRMALEVAGFDGSANGRLWLMDASTDRFEFKGEVNAKNGRAEIVLPRLSIAKVEIFSETPEGCVRRQNRIGSRQLYCF